MLDPQSILPASYDRERPILFYTPEAGVTPHFITQCVLGRTLKELGYKVLFARCTACFNRCPVMDMYNLPYALTNEARTQVCSGCLSHSHTMLASYGLESIDIKDYLDEQMINQVVQSLAEIPARIDHFMFDGLPFGRASVIDFVLATKISNFDNLDGQARTVWGSYIAASLTSYLVVKRMCQALNVGILTYFNDYSLLLSARFAAEKLGIPARYVSLAIHRGIDRRRFVILNSAARPAYLKQVDDWSKWKDLALPADDVSEIAEDLRVHFLGSGAHTYSPAKSQQPGDILTRLNLSPNKKLVVAYTSSLDEYLACRSNMQVFGDCPEFDQPFKDLDGSMQIGWLAELIKYVESKDDVQLIVRVHPREAPNQRNNLASDHLPKLRKHFDRPYKCTRIIWPEDPTSSYDLAELADVVLTSYSSIGLELARLGSPVLASYKGFTLVDVPFLRWAETQSGYFAAFEQLLAQSASLELVRDAFRFYCSYYFKGLSTSLSDVVSDPNNDQLPEFKITKAADVVIKTIIEGQPIQEINKSALQSVQSINNSDQELLTLKVQMRRLLHVIFTGKDESSDYQLTVLRCPDGLDLELTQGIELNASSTQRILLSNGRQCYYSFEGKVHKRHSVMCARLAELGSQVLVNVAQTSNTHAHYLQAAP